VRTPPPPAPRRRRRHRRRLAETRISAGSAVVWDSSTLEATRGLRDRRGRCAGGGAFGIRGRDAGASDGEGDAADSALGAVEWDSIASAFGSRCARQRLRRCLRSSSVRSRPDATSRSTPGRSRVCRRPRRAPSRWAARACSDHFRASEPPQEPRAGHPRQGPVRPLEAIGVIETLTVCSLHRWPPTRPRNAARCACTRSGSRWDSAEGLRGPDRRSLQRRGPPSSVEARSPRSAASSLPSVVIPIPIRRLSSF